MEVPQMSSAHDRQRAAIAVVLNNNEEWVRRALEEIRKLDLRWEGIAEKLRMYTYSKIGRQPGHHNVWGGVIQSAKHLELLFPINRYEPMELPWSHARPSIVYRRSLTDFPLPVLHPGMAEAAGTGPANKTCGDCGNNLKGQCWVYRQRVSAWGPHLQPDYPSCFFFREPKK